MNNHRQTNRQTDKLIFVSGWKSQKETDTVGFKRLNEKSNKKHCNKKITTNVMRYVALIVLLKNENSVIVDTPCCHFKPV